MLRAVVREHLQTLLEEAGHRSEQGVGLPRFVEKEFQRYLECGVLANGFAASLRRLRPRSGRRHLL